MGTTLACLNADINLSWESETLNVLVKAMTTLSGKCLAKTEGILSQLALVLGDEVVIYLFDIKGSSGKEE